MCANDFSVWSHWSHFCNLRPKPIDAFSTGTLCHITPSDSGTRPNILLLNVLTSAPYGPVISLAGIRMDMTPPGCRPCCQHPDTARAHPVTCGRKLLNKSLGACTGASAAVRAHPALNRGRGRADGPTRWGYGTRTAAAAAST